jgi:hypothetical protein
MVGIISLPLLLASSGNFGSPRFSFPPILARSAIEDLSVQDPCPRCLSQVHQTATMPKASAHDDRQRISAAIGARKALCCPVPFAAPRSPPSWHVSSSRPGPRVGTASPDRRGIRCRRRSEFLPHARFEKLAEIVAAGERRLNCGNPKMNAEYPNLVGRPRDSRVRFGILHIHGSAGSG